MNLFINTGATALADAIVNSASDLTSVSRLPDVVYGDSEPLTVKFLSAASTYQSWTVAAGYVVSVSIGELGPDGGGAYVQTSSFADVTNGFSGRLAIVGDAIAGAIAS